MEDNDNSQGELSSFRHQWRHELQQQGRSSPSPVSEQEPSEISNDSPPSPQRASPTTKDVENEDIENKAKWLFLTGVSLEQKRRMPEAVCYYRRAIQLVPDIESKISDFDELTDSNSESDQDLVSDDLNEHCDDDKEDTCEYMTHMSNSLLDVVKEFNKLSTKGICDPSYPTMTTHISALPAEVIMYIFKWVVSTALDLRSLEQLARVCRGFYTLARDTEMWRLVCVRIWGINLGSPVVWSGCWRRMFLERAHMLYNGVYISRISYLRAYEPHFEQSYTPYQVVVYYRYLRFYTDGSVLFDTSPEEPDSSIYRLSKNSQSNVLSGNFKLVGNKVIIIVQKPDPVRNTVISRRGRRYVPPIVDRFFHLELQLQDTKKKRNNRLNWLQYSCQTFQRSTGQTTASEFDITKQFTSFYFSRVRSYDLPSSAPLGLGRP